MNLSDLPSYSSDLNNHSPGNDDDKWISDDPLAAVNPPKSKDLVSEDKSPSIDDDREKIPKLLPEAKLESSSSQKSTKSTKIIQQNPANQLDISEQSHDISEESSSQSASKKSKASQKSEKSTAPKTKHGYAPQIQIALSGNKLAFADGTWQDVSDMGELIDKVHPIVAESICLQKRAELLVKLISESEYESQLIQNEMNECDEIIKELRKILGEDDSESHTTATTEEEESEDF